VEDTLGSTRQAPASAPGLREPLLQTAVRYVEDRHWEVAHGTWLIEDDGPARCSCEDLRCPAPGAHPAESGGGRQASASPASVRRWWTEHPEAAILLPTGRTFDVIDVPEVAGCLALARMERMGVQLGPVVAMPSLGPAGRRLLFLVLPGSLAQLPEMLRHLGWPPGRLDLVGRGDGGWVVAPPSRVGRYSFAQWAREPTALNRWLPEASELISPLAYACGREAPALNRAPR
jgi:hypothetical protein